MTERGQVRGGFRSALGLVLIALFCLLGTGSAAASSAATPTGDNAVGLAPTAASLHEVPLLVYAYDRAAQQSQDTQPPAVGTPDTTSGPIRNASRIDATAAAGFAAEGAGGGAARLGETVSPLGRTYENADSYLSDVAKHYGINLRGVKPVWDYDLGPGVKGLTKPTEGGWTIRINPGFADEPDLANTLAHELSHARDFQKGLTSLEGPAYNSGDALEEWIYGLR